MSGFYRSKLKRPIVAASELSSQGFRRRWIHAIDAVKVALFLLVGLPGCDAQLQRCTDHLGNAARGYVSKKNSASLICYLAYCRKCMRPNHKG